MTDGGEDQDERGIAERDVAADARVIGGQRAAEARIIAGAFHRGRGRAGPADSPGPAPARGSVPETWRDCAGAMVNDW